MPDTIPAGPGPWNAAAGCGTPGPGFTAVAVGGTAAPTGPTGPVSGPTGPTGPTGGPAGPTGPIQPISGLTLSEVLTDLNAEFAELEALNPFLTRILRQVNAAVDAKITALWPTGASWTPETAKTILYLAKLRAVLPSVNWGGILQELPTIIQTVQTLAPVLLQIWQSLQGGQAQPAFPGHPGGFPGRPGGFGPGRGFGGGLLGGGGLGLGGIGSTYALLRLQAIASGIDPAPYFAAGAAGVLELQQLLAAREII
jgi:hypothetical protein